MAKSEFRIKALRLRRKGMSIKNIALHLGVSSGSVSSWCRNIELTRQQKERLRQAQIAGGHRGRMIGAEMNKQKRLRSVREQEYRAKKLIDRLSMRDMLMLGIALYWGEGTKTRDSAVAIINSDPSMILFARNWFEQLGVGRDMFRPYIFIAESHRPRQALIVNYWSQTLKIPKKQFAKVVFLKGKSKKVYENRDSYYGVLALRVRRSAALKQLILSLIQVCKEKAGIAQIVRASHS